MTDAYKLPPRLDLSSAQSLVTHLLSVPEGETTVLDASETTHLGALCAQALIAAGQRSANAGGALQINDVSDRVHAQLGSMGLSLESLMEGQA